MIRCLMREGWQHKRTRRTSGLSQIQQVSNASVVAKFLLPPPSCSYFRPPQSHILQQCLSACMQRHGAPPELHSIEACRPAFYPCSPEPHPTDMGFSPPTGQGPWPYGTTYQKYLANVGWSVGLRDATSDHSLNVIFGRDFWITTLPHTKHILKGRDTEESSQSLQLNRRTGHEESTCSSPCPELWPYAESGGALGLMQ